MSIIRKQPISEKSVNLLQNLLQQNNLFDSLKTPEQKEKSTAIYPKFQ